MLQFVDFVSIFLPGFWCFGEHQGLGLYVLDFCFMGLLTGGFAGVDILGTWSFMIAVGWQYRLSGF